MPYDDEYSSEYPWQHGAYDDPSPFRRDELERLVHLVLVDGRLVDMWSESVRGTRWQDVADRFDREARPALPPPPPPVPPYERVLAWLGQVCGGPDAVAELRTDPLVEDGLDLPEAPDLRSRHRLESTATLLDAVAAQCFDDETSFALRRALLLVWEADPDAVLLAKSAAHLAGGISWAVGKANELYRSTGSVTQTVVRDALGLSGTISGVGGTVQRALRGFGDFSTTVDTYGYSGRSLGVPDLLPLGHPDLLLGSTRTRLVRLRDRALTASAAAAA